MVILKKLYDYYLDKDVWKKEDMDKMVIDFINDEKLKANGWQNSLLEGGFISPDFSTIFYYARTPYEGQLIQFNRDTEGYEKIKDQFIKSGKFIEVK